MDEFDEHQILSDLEKLNRNISHNDNDSDIDDIAESDSDEDDEFLLNQPSMQTQQQNITDEQALDALSTAIDSDDLAKPGPSHAGNSSTRATESISEIVDRAEEMIAEEESQNTLLATEDVQQTAQFSSTFPFDEIEVDEGYGNIFCPKMYFYL